MLPDFTTYSETDPSGWLAVAATTITGTAVDRNATAHITKDYGAGYISGDYTSEFAISIPNYGTNNGGPYAVVHGFTNVAGNRTAVLADAECIDFYTYASKLQVTLRTWDTTGTTKLLYSSTTYYGKLVRSGTTVSMYIYSDAARTTLVASDSVTVSSAHTFTKHICTASHNSGDTGFTCSYTLSDFDIPDVPSATVKPWYAYAQQ